MSRGRRAFEGRNAMRIKAAVLEEMGLSAPYATSKPLKVQEVDLEGPGPG